MYVLINNGQPVVVIKDKTKAEGLAQTLGYSIVEVPLIEPDAEGPKRMKTGFCNFLEPNRRINEREEFVTFVGNHNIQFLNGETVALGERYHSQNLTNYGYTVPIDWDVKQKIFDFWNSLHGRGLDIVRIDSSWLEIRATDKKFDAMKPISDDNVDGVRAVDIKPIQRDEGLTISSRTEVIGPNLSAPK
jgi:hypothetical protein